MFLKAAFVFIRQTKAPHAVPISAEQLWYALASAM
jgi:hypothetical protein